MRKNFRVIKELVKLRFQNLLLFRLGFFGPFFVDGSLFLIQLLVFEAVYRNVDRIGSWGKGEMIIFIGTFSLINAINMIVYFFGVNGISNKIKDGDIDLYLTKPVSPLLRLTFENVNPGSIPLLLLSICIISYGVKTGNMKPQAGDIAGFIICTALMAVLWYEMEVIIRSLSFFVVSTASITKLEEVGIDLCMKVPGIAMKGFFKLIFYCILPYGIMATFPTMCLIGRASITLWAWSAGSVLLFGLLLAVLWKNGIRRYNSVSS